MRKVYFEFCYYNLKFKFQLQMQKFYFIFKKSNFLPLKIESITFLKLKNKKGFKHKKLIWNNFADKISIQI